MKFNLLVFLSVVFVVSQLMSQADVFSTILKIFLK